MARRNLWRSLATASLLLVSTAAAGLMAAAPAGAVDNVQWIVTVSDFGFSQTTINARTGDMLVFQLDVANAQQEHILVWGRGQFPFVFDSGHTTKQYGPLSAGGPLEFSDAKHGGPNFSGTLTVSDALPPPTTTTTVRPPVTTTTAPRSTSTTTAPPTTTTTDGAIHPLLVSNPDPTTTTFAPVPLPVTNTPAKAASAPATTTTVKDKSKAKDGPATSTTTAPPPPPAGLFDTSTLTPAAPAADPAPAAVTDLGGSADVDAALAGILHPDKPSDSGASWLLLASGGFAVLLLLGGGWAWFHRSSRYFPA